MTEPDVRNEGGPDRRSWIMSTLRSAGFIAVVDIARALGVSSMTVRRDLHVLESTQQVRLVHGGAILSPTDPRLGRFGEDGHSAGRARIAAHAAGLVGSWDTIVLDAGPTTYALARALPESFHGSVITHSLSVLHLLDEWNEPPRTVALGGELLADRHAFVGPTTETAVDQLRARTFFLSPSAADARGTYSRSSAEAGVQRRLIGIADQVVLVATHDVFANSAPACVAPLDRLSGLVTDRPLPSPVVAALRRAGVPITVAG